MNKKKTHYWQLFAGCYATCVGIFLAWLVATVTLPLWQTIGFLLLAIAGPLFIWYWIWYSWGR